MKADHQAAKAHRIPVIKPQWLEKVYKHNLTLEQALDSMKDFYVHDLEGWSVASTGFSQLELPLLTARIQVLGGVYTSGLKQSSSMLIVKSDLHASAKADAAKEWGIPVKDGTWLFDEKREMRPDRIVPNEENVALLASSSTVQPIMQGDYLDGLSIFLAPGFSKELRDELRRLVRQGGGNFMLELSEFCTHCVVASPERPPYCSV